MYVAALFSQVQMLVTERQLYNDKINNLASRLNSRMASFNFNYNHTAREPEDMALFLDNIGAPDIEFFFFWTGLRDLIACSILGGGIPTQNSGYESTRLCIS